MPQMHFDTSTGHKTHVVAESFSFPNISYDSKCIIPCPRGLTPLAVAAAAVIHKYHSMYYRSVTSRQMLLHSHRTDASCLLTRWQHHRAWNDVINQSINQCKFV